MNAQKIIEEAWEDRAAINPANAPRALREAVERGHRRPRRRARCACAEKAGGEWVTHQWIKKAVLLSFRLRGQPGHAGRRDPLLRQGADSKFARFTQATSPPAASAWCRRPMARRGAFIAKNVVLMPSYVNIGAYVDEGTMVDTWATVGSCAQIGKNVHLSGGVGIGGVLEPLQANPTIIEDNCFIGARSRGGRGRDRRGELACISMGVFIGQSTKIFDRVTGEILYGRVPAGSVVVSGNLPSADGRYSLYCAVIVKQVDAKTRAKTSLNELLRGD